MLEDVRLFVIIVLYRLSMSWAFEPFLFVITCLFAVGYVLFRRQSKQMKEPSGYVSARIISFMMAACFVSTVSCLVFSGADFSGRDYSKSALMGLTTDQVVQRLGSPHFDPRLHGWRNEERDGPLLFFYSHWDFSRTIIEFKNNHVVNVVRNSK
jgi:hypothetical protein